MGASIGVGRARLFEQGEFVRMVHAPAPWMEFMIGWRFVVQRASWRSLHVRLRADYPHTEGGAATLELSIDTLRTEYACWERA
jgi:hypothetical protein